MHMNEHKMSRHGLKRLQYHTAKFAVHVDAKAQLHST